MKGGDSMLSLLAFSKCIIIQLALLLYISSRTNAQLRFIINQAAAGAAELGECFDTAAGRYTSNATTCMNEGELAADPDPAITVSLCNTTAAGRFNLEELYTNGAVGGPGTPLPQFTGAQLGITRNKNCADPNQIGLVSRCLQSCKLCCKLPKYESCEDTNAGQPCDVRLCSSNVAYAIQQCPATCGKCREAIGQNKDTELCMDLDPDCITKKLAGKCDDPGVEKVCAFTCNLLVPGRELCREFTAEKRAILMPTILPPPAGVPIITPNADDDKASNCKDNKDLCANPVYREFMQENCRKTCKSASGTSLGCSDKPHTNCVVWKRNGFCENDFYSEATKKEYCADTCKLC